MNLKLPRYQSMPADQWPEVLAMILGSYWILLGPFIPDSLVMIRIMGTALGISVAHCICKKHFPGSDAAPLLRARYYLRVGAVYLTFVLAIKVLPWLFVMAVKTLGGASV